MFNEEQKIKFIRDYTSSISTAHAAETVFNSFEPYEAAWGSDLCTQPAETLQPVLDELTGLRAKSRWTSVSILREYAKWCLAVKVPGACDGMLNVETAGLEKIRKQMVSGPFHLQVYLDHVFDPESLETIDSIYRCYFWMAFGGIEEKDVPLIKKDEVDFTALVIRYSDANVPLYKEAIPAFQNAVQLNSFLYRHPNYANNIRRDRVQGDTIMRGIKAETQILTIRSILSHRVAHASKCGNTNQQLSYHRAWLSGLFYRTYERERAGIPADFSEAALRFMSGKTYSLSQRETQRHKQNRVEKDFMEDYRRWKLAFGV